MGYAYVLQSKKDYSYYIGSTRNIEKRLKDHNLGKVLFTKSRLPVILKFLKEFNNYSEAYQFEVKVKSWKKRKSIEKMICKPDNIAFKYCGIG